MTQETKTPTGTVRPPEAVPAPEPPRRRPVKLIAVACGALVVAVASLAALLWPAAPAPRAAEAPAAGDATALAGTAPVRDTDGCCQAPAAGAAITALVAADHAYDAGDFERARSLYLDVLLEGGALCVAADDVLGWTHGRLALALARTSRGAGEAMIPEPKITFRGAQR